MPNTPDPEKMVDVKLLREAAVLVLGGFSLVSALAEAHRYDETDGSYDSACRALRLIYAVKSLREWDRGQYAPARFNAIYEVIARYDGIEVPEEGF